MSSSFKIEILDDDYEEKEPKNSKKSSIAEEVIAKEKKISDETSQTSASPSYRDQSLYHPASFATSGDKRSPKAPLPLNKNKSNLSNNSKSESNDSFTSFFEPKTDVVEPDRRYECQLEIGTWPNCVLSNLDASISHPGSVLVVPSSELSLKNAANLKALGNEEFKKKQYQRAIQYYTRAIMHLPNVGSKIDLTKTENDDGQPQPTNSKSNTTTSHVDVTAIELANAVYLSNRAACRLALKHYHYVIDDCSQALELDHRYVKAYLRRAKAFEKLDKLEEAVKDLDEVLKIDPSLYEVMTRRQRLAAQHKEKMEKMKNEMFGKLKGLGNSILSNFGMSLDNFNVNQDPNTGSYSINYNPNANG